MCYVRICAILDGKYDAAVSRKYGMCDDAERMHSPRNPFSTDVEIYIWQCQEIGSAQGRAQCIKKSHIFAFDKKTKSGRKIRIFLQPNDCFYPPIIQDTDEILSNSFRKQRNVALIVDA